MNRGISSCSSAIAVGVVMTMCGALLIRLAGPSSGALALGVMVLLGGLIATVVSLLRSSRTTAERPAAPAVQAATRAAAPNVSSRRDTTSSNGPNSHSGDSSKVAAPEGGSCAVLTRLMESFESWWKGPLDPDDLWRGFDRWVRDVLHELAGAKRIRCFRVSAADLRLSSLTGDLDDPSWLGAKSRGLIEHVIQSGRPYIHGAPDAGELVPRLLNSEGSPTDGPTEPPPQWLLPIRTGGQTVGLVIAGELDAAGWQSVEILQAAGHILQLVWRQVQQQAELWAALQTDRASGVLNRIDLAQQAEQLLTEAANDEEPVVVLTLAIEGVRRLEDGKHWELQDWLMHQVGKLLRRRLRTDDIVGRFSEDRFVAVLRRLDLSLGKLIASKVLTSLNEAIDHGDATLADSVGVRCGLAADTRCGFESLLGRAFDALQQAREQRVEMAALDWIARHGDGTGRSELVKIDVQKMGSVMVLSPRAAVAGGEVDDFVASVEDYRRKTNGRIVLECSQVPFLDSRGVEALWDLADRQREAGQSTKLAAVPELCREIFELTGISPHLDLFDSAESAVRSFL